ncbi:MAG TPA: hypothetical protein VMV46_12850 [Thermoanaerobaculia bacterium]|nr:hypothetical protein [Thermoanaerobaculia bacterium]
MTLAARASTPSPTFERLLASGRELRTTVAELPRSLAECEDRGQVMALLDDLHERLSRRFEREEAGGYLSEVLTDAPRLTREAGRLRGQHGELLERLDRLEAMAERCSEATEWQELTAAASRFRDALARHEQAENALIEEIVTTDLGGPD